MFADWIETYVPFNRGILSLLGTVPVFAYCPKVIILCPVSVSKMTPLWMISYIVALPFHILVYMAAKLTLCTGPTIEAFRIPFPVLTVFPMLISILVSPSTKLNSCGDMVVRLAMQVHFSMPNQLSKPITMLIYDPKSIHLWPKNN